MAISNNSTGLRPGVCTSTTRPSAPYEGQHIYETDTDIEYVWNGSAWVVNYVSAASPAFTGTPTAPTATAGTNTTQIATTAFVRSLIQFQGGSVSAGPSGTTVTFVSGRFTNLPTVTLGPSYEAASGADPTGFAFIPYGGGPSTASVIIKCSSAMTIVVKWAAIATNF
jgi:hypothetical protein